jgi:hypothetical protein
VPPPVTGGGPGRISVVDAPRRPQVTHHVPGEFVHNERLEIANLQAIQCWPRSSMPPGADALVREPTRELETLTTAF